MRLKAIALAVAASFVPAVPLASASPESWYYANKKARSRKFTPTNAGSPTTRTGSGTRRKGAEPPTAVECIDIDTIVCGYAIDSEEAVCGWVTVCVEPLD